MVLVLVLAVLSTLVLAPVGGGARAAQAAPQAEVLSEARRLVRQGLLGEAADLLSGLGADSGDASRGHAEILLGNIAYERGRFVEAAERYRRAAAGFQRALAAGEDESRRALDAAQENLALATSHQARHEDLAGRVSTLRAVFAAVVAGAGLAVALLARRARAAAATG